MGYLLANRLEVSIFINDKEYRLSSINVLSSLHIGASARTGVPTLTMQLKDVGSQLDTLGVQDGIPIRVVIAPFGRKSKTYNFRKFNHEKELNGGVWTWTIVGYWDAPLYWNTTTIESFRGTSGDAMAMIAQRSGLAYKGINTNDSQLWLPQNMNYRSWARDIAAHGYVNDGSCTMVALDLDNTLRYVDINNLQAPSKKVIAYHIATDAYTAVDMKLASGSGFNNAITGYQNLRRVQSLTAPDDSIADLTFDSKVRSPQYNKPLKDRLGRGPVRFGPIDVGNVHAMYERASYQNARYQNLYSLGLELLLSSPTDIELFDTISYSTQKENTDPDVVNSGVYLVDSHAIYVEGASYFEKIGIVRHGTNDTYTGG